MANEMRSGVPVDPNAVLEAADTLRRACEAGDEPECVAFYDINSLALGEERASRTFSLVYAVDGPGEDDD